MKQRWKTYLRHAFWFALVLGGILPAFALDNIALQLKWTHSFQFAGYYAAQDKGYYREAGLAVRILEATPGSDPVGNVLAGQAEYGVGTSSLLLQRNAGKPVVALGVIFQHSPYILLSRQNGPIQSIHDLDGKRVMLEPQAEELLAYLKKEDIPLERITRVEHSFDPQDLVLGKVDAISAYVINQPYYLDRAHFSYQIYNPRSAGIDFYGDNLFTTEREIQANPERVKAFRAASLRGWQYAMSHPEEIADLIRAKYSRQHSRDYLLFQARQMLPLIQPELVEIGYTNPGRWRHIAEIYVELGMLPADFSLDSFLYDLNPQRNLTWLYRTLAIALLVIAFSSAVAYRLSRLSAALRTSEERFRLVADNAQDVLWKYDLRQQCLSYISPAVERLTGYTVEEAMAQSIDESFTAASALAVRAAVAYLTTHPEDSKSVMELESLRKDGSTVWSEATMSLIHGANGKAAEVVGVSRDVTARRLVQEQQKRFLAMVSHEFRTPMNAILGMAELLAETELTPEQSKYLEVFQNAGNNLLDLINDILDLSKVEAGQFQLYPEDFALAPILQAQLELLSPRAHEKGLELRLSIAADVPAYVHGDAQRLKQCITNLVGNALKFCHEGYVSIAAECDRDAPDMLHFSVSDTGIGIPADKLDAIFEAFNQADSHITRNYGGTGLGLTITQRLVELMAGRIWVESTPGHGSIFHFTARLPEVTHPVIQAEAKPAGNAALRSFTRPPSILLAEDNQNNVFLMRSLLKSTPCRVDVADNGATAVEKFRTKHYDLILMDVEMPLMDGYSATREIRRIEQEEDLQQTQIYALTAHAFKEDEAKSLNAGCNGHLTKPIRKQVLLDVLNALPLERQAANAADAQRSPAQTGNAKQIIASLAGNEHFDFPAALAHLEIEPELFLTVLGLFRDALPLYRQGIAQAFAGGDMPEARRQAHSLKGEAATVGARLLSSAAAELQSAIDQGETGSYASLQARIEELIAAASLVLADLPRSPS
ncbi:MAG: ABC transporter substrate-binding protein [Sterolibacterium sp.]|nr:ABC transporter substrate-binding protein [Sterolibacterium sp.]